MCAPARADDVEKARELFTRGLDAYQAGDLEGARTFFRDAEAAHHAPAIVYNIGLVEEKLEHPQAAVDAYERYVAEAGDAGELATPATSAIVQIKARSTRLRVQTKPPGARVFLDGAPLADSSVLVTAAHHVLVAQGDDWRAEQEIEARGGGELLNVTLAAPAPSPPASLARTPVVRAPLSAPTEARPDDLTWGAAFAFVPAYMLGVTTKGATNDKAAATIVAGPLVELGYALTERFEVLARALGGLGPDGKPTYAWMGGPGLSFEAIRRRLWIGATFTGGQLETKAGNPKARYGTDIVFGALTEVNVVVLDKPSGQWMAGIQPAFLLTEMHNDNTTFFFPFTFGYRSY